ncbi:hypothetical protein LCGC14_1483350, partial [marine sediment metagenome]
VAEQADAFHVDVGAGGEVIETAAVVEDGLGDDLADGEVVFSVGCVGVFIEGSSPESVGKSLSDIVIQGLDFLRHGRTEE